MKFYDSTNRIDAAIERQQGRHHPNDQRTTEQDTEQGQLA